MIQHLPHGLRRTTLALAAVISTVIFAARPASAQSQQMEQKLMGIKAAQAAARAGAPLLVQALPAAPAPESLLDGEPDFTLPAQA